MKLEALQQRILAKLTRPPTAGKIAAAVSGGCDSVAMLLLLCEWCRMHNLELCVFHVDHGLRPESSDDAVWVRALAERLGLEYFQRNAGSDDVIEGARHGSEAWARSVRYAAFAGMLDESEADYVATAHSADDQAETVLMRLMRGSSWQGLSGIGSRVKLKFAGRVCKVWRPLLNVCRSELEEFLSRAGQSWREDSTNKSSLYFRNRIRNQLLPLMTEMRQGTSGRLVALSEEARLLNHYLSRSAEKFVNKFGTLKSLKVYITPMCTLRRQILQMWVGRIASCERVSRALLIDLDRLWKEKRTGRQVCFANLRIRRHSDSLVAEAKDAMYTVVPAGSVKIEPAKAVEFMGWRFLLTIEKPQVGGSDEIIPIPLRFSDNLLLRCRQAGDLFAPAGGCGSKKLAKWLIDKKVPVEFRDSLPLLVSGNQILLVAGYACSSLLKNLSAEKNVWLSVGRPCQISE